MTRRSRAGLVAFTFLALLLAGLTVAWFVVTARMEVELQRWQQAQQVAGVFVRFGAIERGGWPLAAQVALPEVTIATDTPGQLDAIAWQAARVTLSLAPLHPLTLAIAASGAQSLRFGAAPAIPLSFGALHAAAPLDMARQGAVDVEARALGLAFETGSLTVDRLGLRLRANDAFVSLSDAQLPLANLPFGGTVQSLDVHARWTGAWPPMRDPAAALAAWRDSGQHLYLDGLALRWGPLDVRGSATLGLDRALQPDGTASVQMTGWREVLEALARSGAITRSDAKVVETLLSLVAKPGGGDGEEADLPLTLHDRTLSVGAIPILRVPPLAIP